MERSLSDKIEYVLSVFDQHGISIPPGSRLDQVRRVFLDEHGRPRRQVSPEDPNFRIAQEALRDIYLLEPILASISAIRLNRDQTSAIKTLLKDAAIPRATQPMSKGRDLQAELLTAAACVRGGMNDAALQDPPDVQATIAGRRWGIAVKRLKKAERLDDNMRDGAEQVERSGLKGVIWLDISLAFNQTSTPLLAPSAEAFEAAHARRLRLIVDMNKKEIFSRARAKGVGVVYIFDSQIRQVPDLGWGLGTMNMQVATVGDPETRALYRPFTEAFEKGTRELPGEKAD